MELSALLALLKKLQETQSPAEKKLFISEFFDEQEIDKKDPEVKALLVFYQEAIDKKKQQGSQGGTVTSKTKANVKSAAKKSFIKDSIYDKPMFVEDYKHKGICKVCGKLIDSKNAFRWMKNGVYIDYHALPECFPEGEKHLFTGNRKYNRFVMPIKIDIGVENYESN